jgi:hypothetical protein
VSRVSARLTRLPPLMVLATIAERHRIPGVANDGRWSTDPLDVYPGWPGR